MMRLLPVSLDAMLVEQDDLTQSQALLIALQDAHIAGVTQIVPAARTLLVSFEPSILSFSDLARRISDLRPAVDERPSGELVTIPVRYDGEDLIEVAQHLGITPEEVVRRHVGSEYHVAFTGFAPGFAYLTGGHPSLDVPRRASPRTRIPAGAVGLAGRFSGIYPQASPGGWQLIGITDLPMWDLARERPALLQPGQRVRFVESDEKMVIKPNLRQPPAVSNPVFEVLSPGPQALFQDLGRRGQASQGVSACGAMDRAALRAANRIVGNAPGEAAIEIACGGFELACLADAVVCVTGAHCPLELLDADGRRLPVRAGSAFALAAGDRLRLGQARSGMRAYLAARGGFDVAPVLGSCSRDTLASIGPPPLAPGDFLAVKPLAHAAITGMDELAPRSLPSSTDEVTLDIVMGPRADWFDAQAIERLCSQAWHVTPQSNRVGIRLQGERPLARAPERADSELPSEGTVAGALQVPPSGQPVLFLADHPVTGGYPVIACVAPYHLDLAGQVPVGSIVRLRAIRAFEPLETQT